MEDKSKKIFTREQKIEAANSSSAADIAWQMFKKSGNINYYRLYSDLKKKDE